MPVRAAIVGLQRGDRAPPARADIAQIVERGVIALRRYSRRLTRRSAASATSARLSRSISAPCPRSRGAMSASSGGRSASASSRSPSSHAPSSPSRSWPRSRGTAASRRDPPERAADIGQRCAASRAGSRAARVVVEPLRPDRAAPRSRPGPSAARRYRAASNRAPAPVTVRSTASSRLPLRVPGLRLRSSSRLSRVAASIAIVRRAAR